MGIGSSFKHKKKSTRTHTKDIQLHPASPRATHTHTANGALTARCPLRGPLRSSIFEGGEDAQLTKTAVTGGYRNSTQHASATPQTTRVHLLAGYTSPCRCWKGVFPQHRAIATKKSAAHEARHAQATGIRSTPLLGWVRLHFRAVAATTSVHLPPRPQH